MSLDALHFLELDGETRAHMLAELDLDIATSGAPYSGKETLTARGEADYPHLLRDALASGTEVDLIAALDSHERALTPANASRLGGTEFNRYYIRGICLRARGHGINTVISYRARASATPRASSIALEGQELAAPRILANLRGNRGGDVTTGVGQVYSGMSVRCGCRPCLGPNP